MFTPLRREDASIFYPPLFGVECALQHSHMVHMVLERDITSLGVEHMSEV